MSKNLDQIFTANPITTNASTDLMYFMQSPYTSGTDAGMLFSDFAAQFNGVTAAEVQQAAFNYGGVLNNFNPGQNDYAISLSPAITSYTTGLIVIGNPLFFGVNTAGAMTLNVNGLGAQQVWVLNGGSIQVPTGNELAGFMPAIFIYTATGIFILINPANAPGVAGIQTASYIAGVDAGSSNAYAINLSPPLPSYNNGAFVTMAPAASSNTGACTLNVNGLGDLPIVTNFNEPLIKGQILPGGAYTFYCDGTRFVILNPSEVPTISYNYQAPSTGFSLTQPNNTIGMVLDPSGTLATGTVIAPSLPINGQVWEVSSSQIVISLTISPNGGQTISNVPTSIAAGQGFSWRWNATTSNWMRRY